MSILYNNSITSHLALLIFISSVWAVGVTNIDDEEQAWEIQDQNHFFDEIHRDYSIDGNKSDNDESYQDDDNDESYQDDDNGESYQDNDNDDYDIYQGYDY